MRTVNTYTAHDYSRRCILKVDANGHYHLERYIFEVGKRFVLVQYGKTKFKHIESAQRAITKWLK